MVEEVTALPSALGRQVVDPFTLHGVVGLTNQVSEIDGA
jgi:hypothetical protein